MVLFSVVEKIGKPKYERVKSSGYGNMSPGRPPRDSSREKDFIGFNITKAGRSLKVRFNPLPHNSAS